MSFCGIYHKLTTALSVVELSVAQHIFKKEFFRSLIMLGFC